MRRPYIHTGDLLYHPERKHAVAVHKECPAPIELIREIGGRREEWHSGTLVKDELPSSHASLFEDFPEVPKRIARLYQDPLTNQAGSLTDTRNYSRYARGMNEIIRLKYLDIRDAIRPGRIVDEGCADGALLAEMQIGSSRSEAAFRRISRGSQRRPRYLFPCLRHSCFFRKELNIAS